MAFPSSAGSNTQALTVDAHGNIVFATLSDDYVQDNLSIDGGTMKPPIGVSNPSTGGFTSLNSSTTLTANVLTAANLMTENYGFQSLLALKVKF